MPDGPGAALIDVDRDGHVDVLLRGRIWRNLGGGRFEKGAVLPGSHHSFGDFDNDGDLDVYATSFRESGAKGVKLRQWLLRMDGPGKYVNVIEGSGLAGVHAGKAHGFFDANGDGNLDLFVAGYERVFGQPGYAALPDHLLLGDGEGTFVEATAAAGLEVPPRQAVGVAFCDFDNDGHLDIYVANYRLQPNFLWRNRGDGTFTDVAAEAGATSGRAHSSGVHCVDFDRDGDFDIYVANLSHAEATPPQPRSVLLRNEILPTGELRFTDVTEEMGLSWSPPPGCRAEADWENALLEDFDNDGWRDAFVTESCQGGTNHPALPAKYRWKFDSGYSRMWLRAGEGGFLRIDTRENHLRVEDSWGAAAADIGGDGRIDLLVGSNTWKYPPENDWFDPGRQRMVLLRNEGVVGDAGTPRHWITLALTARDRALTGARVEVGLGGGARLVAVLDTSYGGYSVNSNQLHFGLGSAKVVEIVVRFPGTGSKVRFRGSGWRDVPLRVDCSKRSRKRPRVVKVPRRR